MQGFTMNIFCKVILFCLVIVNSSFGQETKQKKRTPGIQVFINPRDGVKQSKPSSQNGNLIEAEKKAIQLKILSGEDTKDKVDLIIAATKEVQATDQSLDRYSPTYNSEIDMRKERSSGSLNEDLTLKGLEPSRQDQSSYFSPDEFADILPFAAMRSLLPQSLFSNGNHFSPMENIRHLEQNFEREVLPRALSNGARSHSGNIPLDMMVTHPAYSQGIVSNYQHQPDYQGNSYSQNGGQQITHEPQTFHGMPVREHVPIIQSAPMPIYPLVNPTPSGRPNEKQQGHYENLRPEYERTYLHSQIQNQDRMPNHRHYYVPKSTPKSHLDQPLSSNNEHDRHRDQRIISNQNTQNFQTNSEYRHPESIPHQSQISDLQKSLYHNTHPIRNPQIGNEQQDRNRYYIPVNHEVRPQQMESNYPSQHQPSLRHQPPRHHNYRTINMIHEKPLTSSPGKLEREIPPNKPAYRQVPHYTLVPRESLPKYLQKPFPNQHQTAPGDLRTNHEQHRPYDVANVASLIPQDRTKQQFVPYPLGNERDTVIREELRPVYHPHGSRSYDNRMRSSLRDYHNEHPHRNTHSRSAYDVQQVPEEDSVSNHAMSPGGQPTYDLSEVDLDTLPRKKLSKKGRKRMKSKKDDLEHQSSHQYVIKII